MGKRNAFEAALHQPAAARVHSDADRDAPPPASDGAAASAADVNARIVDILVDLGTNERNAGQVHKYNAYRKAALTVKQHPTPITSGKEAAKLPGIGKKIAAKIDEILSTGKLKKLEQANVDEHTQTVNLLTRVTGIGPAAARKLFDEGVRTLDDLKKKTLTHHQTIGLKHFHDFESRIPRAEVAMLERFIREQAAQVDPALHLMVCGSFRRGAASSGDIDILMTHKNHTSTSPMSDDWIARIVNRLKSAHFITDDLTLGPKKYMGVCRLPKTYLEAHWGELAPLTDNHRDASSLPKLKSADDDDDDDDAHDATDAKGPAIGGLPLFLFRRLDIRMFFADQFPLATLYFTGSDELNREMRIQAQKKGFILNEYSLSPIGETRQVGQPLPVESEEDVFEYLGMAYLPPEKRNV